jgi:predicted helicase
MRDEQTVSIYVDAVRQQYTSGHAREHAYRPALERLMSSFEDITAVNDPKRSQHGNPDFVFVKKSNKDITFGYAEAKDITIDLAKTVNTEQLRRYAGYEKLFLTNYIDFIFFRNGEKYEEVSIGKIKNNELEFDQSAFARLQDILQEFLDQPPETIRSGKRLALIMGGKARRIRDNVLIYLSHEDNEKNVELEKIFKMMKELLVHDLTFDKFADMYAQTLVYGLFVARYNDKTPENFSRKEARDLVPASNPFLREFFDHIVGPRFDSRLSHIVDELCDAFAVSNVEQLIQKHLRLFEVENEKDPIIHFYEDFLKEYDPGIRKKMGAYYTPVPVVKFIINQVDEILKKDFDLPKGLADTSKKQVTVTNQGVKAKVDLHKVQILDPAVGTATFLNEIIKHIHNGFKGQEGSWPSYVERDLLPRLHGFELMMAPYTIAHLKLDMTLKETKIDSFEQRLGVYLTNTLEEGVQHQSDIFNYLGLAETISKEADKAAKIKNENPIMVIVGNPPYSGESSNKTAYANSLVDKYKFEPGGKQKLRERTSKWINDDYVKFISFAEDMIEKNGEGIVGMITNHAYLSNPTFRGMRWHLSKTFDKIYILDLHGNSKKKEVSPDGSKDENVFDIQQGVAVILGVKINNKLNSKFAAIYHSEMYGTRKTKFNALTEKITWQQISIDEETFYFTNKNLLGQNEYAKYFSVKDLFVIGGVGTTTAHDNFVIDINKKDLLKKFQKFKDSNSVTEDLYEEFSVRKKKGWNIQDGWRNIQGIDKLDSIIKPISYRPFDKRYIFYEDKLVWRTVKKIMGHFLKGENIGLVASRLNRQLSPGYFFITDSVSDFHILDSAADSTSIFPLYLIDDNGEKTTNFNPEVLKLFIKNVKQEHKPENILDYIYAVFHSQKYREKYKEFLKNDFPRIPIPKNDKEFKDLSKLGKQLRELHLMTDSALDGLITTFSERGTDEVEQSPQYNGHKVWINDNQYFGNVPEVAWNFYIGGYQPAQKWLKDRKNRKLTHEDIKHYQKIIKVLVETDKIMKQIDKVWDVK